MSDDGAYTLVLIAMLGNVFSPRYFAARRALGSRASPLTYCTFHVALGGGPSRFALSETDRVARSDRELCIGDSALQWTGRELRAHIDERTAFGRRIVGTVRLSVSELLTRDVQLDRQGRHRWTPLAPAVRAEVELSTPRLRFSGHGYLDANEGDEGLEQGFSSWSWARLTDAERATTIAYDTVEADGPSTARLFRVEGGEMQDVVTDELHAQPLAPTVFRLHPQVRLDAGSLRRAVNMQDAPFYCRSQVEGSVFGAPCSGVHEWLDLARFQNAWVQRMIPYRMRGGFPRSGEPR